MAVELKVPSAGESITEVVIASWMKKVGDAVALDEPLVEIDTDKATMAVGAPVAGVIKKLMKADGDTARVGEVIAVIDESGANGKAAKPAKEPAKAAKEPSKEPAKEPAKEAAKQPQEAPKPAPKAEAPAREPFVMPAAQRVLHEKGIPAQSVPGTGPGGRVTKEDALNAAPVAASPVGFRETETVRMTTLRKRIAQRLVESQQTAAILTTFNEIDMKAVMDLRAQYKEEFSKRHGINLGFMSFFVKAAVDALRLVPGVNGRIEGDSIIYHNYQDIGVAVGGGKGLLVPVIRNAERLSFSQIEQTIADFGKRAKDNAITPDEMQGGTFTISNGGIYGSLLSTPIINPPQSGILGMHAIQDRPVARDGQVVIRPMMYVALSYDHRLVDGREAVTFLKRIKDCIENPARMLLEI